MIEEMDSYCALNADQFRAWADEDPRLGNFSLRLEEFHHNGRSV